MTASDQRADSRLSTRSRISQGLPRLGMTASVFGASGMTAVMAGAAPIALGSRSYNAPSSRAKSVGLPVVKDDFQTFNPFGTIGIERRRVPVAWKIAFPTAGAMPTMGVSPAPAE